MTKKVFVLGAGFSKAIEGAMPLTTELHTEVFERLKDWEYFPKLEKINSKINGDSKDLEKLLSFLAEKQIWQNYEESNDHNTLYEELKEEINKVLEEKEDKFKILEADDWILKLFLNIIGQNIDVITFNYDQLVEKIIYHFPMPNSYMSGHPNIDFGERENICVDWKDGNFFRAYNFYKGYFTEPQEFQDWANFLYSKVIIGQPRINKEVKLKRCVSIKEFIKISLVYNSSYFQRRLTHNLVLSGQIDPFFDYRKEFVDTKMLNEILPETVYEERFIKKIAPLYLA